MAVMRSYAVTTSLNVAFFALTGRVPGVTESRHIWVYTLTHRVLSIVRIASVPVAMVTIENRAQNDVNGPRHAPYTLVSITSWAYITRAVQR